MITGNVTQASLDLGNLIWKGFKTGHLSKESIKRHLALVSGILGVCILGGLSAKCIGLQAVMVPGLALAAFFLVQKDRSLPV